MNGPDDRNDAPPAGGAPELEAAYARASRADGTRPSLSTRASILANARREAAERAAQVADAADPVGVAAGASRNPRFDATPAANDSLWTWRAAAGFVGIGFAGVMALWLYHGNPAPQAPAPSPPVAPAVLPEAQSSLRMPAAGRAADTAVTAADVRDAARATAGSPPAAEAVSADNAAPAAAAPVPALARAAAPAALAERAALKDQPIAPAAEALLQRWFPQALDRDSTGQQYWFALDRDGAVLGSGQRAWRDLTALQGALQAEVAPRRIVRIEAAHVVNRRGRDIEVAYAWTAAD